MSPSLLSGPPRPRVGHPNVLSSTSQHHRLPPAAAPSAAPLSAVPPASIARLGEFFDLIKAEFETVAQDGGNWKVQRDEYEAKSELCPDPERVGRARLTQVVSQQINELGMIRQSLYELEATHAKVRQE